MEKAENPSKVRIEIYLKRAMSEKINYCPVCDSNWLIRNGLIHNVTQNFKYQHCNK